MHLISCILLSFYFFCLGIQKDRRYQEERRYRQNETKIWTINSRKKVKTAVVCWYYHEHSSTTFTAHRLHWLIWQGWIIIIQYTFFTSVKYSQTVSIKSCEHFSYLLKVPEGLHNIISDVSDYMYIILFVNPFVII